LDLGRYALPGYDIRESNGNGGYVAFCAYALAENDNVSHSTATRMFDLSNIELDGTCVSSASFIRVHSMSVGWDRTVNCVQSMIAWTAFRRDADVPLVGRRG